MPPQYQVLMAEAVKEQLRDVVARAAARSRREEALRAARKIYEGLTWLADELGESRFPLNVLGELRVVVIGPVGAVFAVDRAARRVQVGRFTLSASVAETALDTTSPDAISLEFHGS